MKIILLILTDFKNLEVYRWKDGLFLYIYAFSL